MGTYPHLFVPRNVHIGSHGRNESVLLQRVDTGKVEGVSVHFASLRRMKRIIQILASKFILIFFTQGGIDSVGTGGGLQVHAKFHQSNPYQLEAISSFLVHEVGGVLLCRWYSLPVLHLSNY